MFESVELKTDREAVDMPTQHKRPASKYACPYCQGKGRIEIEGTGMESYASSCLHCHGSGERMIEIPLREYE